MTDTLTCDAVDEHDLVAKFVAGRLTEEEIQALEAHCLECDRCWSELRLALGIHAMARPATVEASLLEAAAPSAPVTSRRLPPWLLAAAAVVVLVTGASWLAQRKPPVADIERGALPLEQVNVSLQDGKAVISWPPVEGASRYVVLVHAPDGHLLSSRETTATRAEFDHSTIAASGALATVEAYSALGDLLATSAPTPISSRSKP